MVYADYYNNNALQNVLRYEDNKNETRVLFKNDSEELKQKYDMN
jgi:hypothetical protein